MVAVLGPSVALAGEVPVAAVDARTWLQRMQVAASRLNYQGTLVISAGGSMSSARLAHYCEGQQYLERVDMLDGQPRHVYRHNDEVLTLWPAAKVARVEQRESVAMFPAVLSGSEEQLLDRYHMLADGVDRVAGLDAAVFVLRPKDAYRFAHRLWADRASGLLLRADVMAPDGRVLEAAAFTEVSIGVKPRPESVLVPMKSLEGYRVLRSAPERTALEAEGWRLTPPVAGFRQISCVKRGMATASDGGGGAPAAVLQTIFSDGLTHVSVFIEPFRADRHRPGTVAVGATHTLMQPHGASWITVMGDVPMGTLKKFAAALERQR